MTPEDRLSYYLGECVQNHVVDLSLIKNVFDCKAHSVVFCTKKIAEPCFFPNWWNTNYKHYINDIDCLHTSFTDIGFFLYLYFTKKINEQYYDLPIISIARNIGDKNLILLKYDHQRQWSLDIKTQDLDWENKLSEPVWRGQPSGVPVNKHPSRATLVSKFYDKYNIAYSPPPNIELAKKNNKVLSYDPMYIEHINPHLSINQQLQYKYLISMEGNDVSSGLGWMLNSNSVVLMPKPTQESWLMHGKLIPWEHYVPLTDDLDLEDKLEWCKSHDKECQKISKNANLYMEMFQNEEIEKFIFDSVLSHYKANVTFI